MCKLQSNFSLLKNYAYALAAYGALKVSVPPRVRLARLLLDLLLYNITSYQLQVQTGFLLDKKAWMPSSASCSSNPSAITWPLSAYAACTSRCSCA